MLEGLTPPKLLRSCAVRTVLNSLNETDKKVFLDAVNDEQTWPASTLSKSLSSHGVDISDRSIRHHRSKACSCSRV